MYRQHMEVYLLFAVPLWPRLRRQSESDLPSCSRPARPWGKQEGSQTGHLINHRLINSHVYQQEMSRCPLSDLSWTVIINRTPSPIPGSFPGHKLSPVSWIEPHVFVLKRWTQSGSSSRELSALNLRVTTSHHSCCMNTNLWLNLWIS